MTDSIRTRPNAPSLAFAERYVPVALLGAGSYAEVFRAEDRVTGGAVALKILHDRVADSAVWPARERFEREIAVMQALSHPAVVPVLDHGYRPDPMLPALARPAIVLPLVDGETLAAVIERREPWPLSRVVAFLESVVDVLVHLQVHDVVHRDLGPQNVFVTPEGGFRVADFGMARPLDAAVVTRLSGTLTEALAARVLYVDAANRGGVLTSASDVISVARIAIALARGRHYVGPLRGGEAAVDEWPDALVALLNAAAEDGAAIGPEEFLVELREAMRDATDDVAVLDAPPRLLDQPRRSVGDAQAVREIEDSLPPRFRTGDSAGLIYGAGVGLALMGVVALVRSSVTPEPLFPTEVDGVFATIPYVAVFVLGCIVFVIPPDERRGRIRKIVWALIAFLVAFLWFRGGA